MAIQVGDILGDYRVTGVLGRGGMGKVFRVRSLLTDREEAMKVVLPDLDENPALAERFLREMKVHASLQHPNIASLHTALRLDGRLVMILELVEGVSLEELLPRGPLEVPAAVHYVDQVLAALAFAHERGVIHRDIKPANILIAAGGVAKITDFGVARSGLGPRLTGTGMAVGTLAYMSPEQLLTGTVDARSDIYSLGLTFYEAVTGHRPIPGDSEHALMNAQLNIVPAGPSIVNPQVPPAISAAIMRALAKDPAQRFQTALEFQAALAGHGHAPAPAPSFTAIPEAAGPGLDLADLEARLSRAIGPIAKRLVSDAARRYSSIPEIRKALASEIDDPREREKFLKSQPEAAATHATHATRAPSPGVFFDPVMLERLSQALAPYIGPVAKILVTRAARTASNLEELHQALAAELPAAERPRFLNAARSLP